MLKKIWMLVAVLAAMAFAAPANAKVSRLIVEGTVISAAGGGDWRLFGVLPADLVGRDYSVAFLFDSEVGDRIKTGQGDSVAGGTFRGNATPLLKGELTINGYAFTFYGPTRAAISTGNAGPFGVSRQTVHDYDTSDGLYVDFYSDIRANGPNTLGVSLDAPFSYVLQTGDAAFGGVSINRPLPDMTVLSVTAGLKPRSIRLETLGVPEPATWIVMIIGFGVTGLALRRRPALT